MVCRLGCGIGGGCSGLRWCGGGWGRERKEFGRCGEEVGEVRFVAMVEKIEMLCEGISYLLFQQLVEG